MQTLIYFLLWAGVIFFMMRFGCGAHVMGHGHGHGGAGHEGDAAGKPPAKAVDPVCGMTVDTAGARSSFYDGRAYYFCSQNCREKFEKSPADYAKGTSARMSNMEQAHEHQH
jgi:YHS domain-containing protein